MDDRFDARFFIQSDPHTDTFLFKIPDTWPFRRYEYLWAAGFAAPGDTVLDAACGICHPLKFYLSDYCKEVHACDGDGRILEEVQIRKDIHDVFGEEAAKNLPPSYFKHIHYKKAQLNALPYEDGKFDKLFCISVLEHLGTEGIKHSLKEFSRVLKENGMIVLTFDYPPVDPNALQKAISTAGLKFAGEADFTLPADAITTDLWGKYYCYRCILVKADSHNGVE